MQKINLNMGALSLKNLAAKPARTVCLVVVAAILAFILFGGSIIAFNLQQGLATITKRFGADLMVVPAGAADRAQTLLLRGDPNYFYFSSALTDSVAKMEGVIQVSPQFYFASLAESECCDTSVQLIAFDPDTDFVVQPWIAEKYNEKVADGQVVVGSRITLRANGSIKLFGREYFAAAQLSPSASGFDTSIFMTMNTMRGLVADAGMKNIDDNMISAVLARTDPAANPSVIALNIRDENEGVEVVVSQGIFGRIAAALSGFVKYIQIFSVALWVLAVVVLAAVFSGIIHERKKEFALLRIVGATQKRLVGIVLSESALASIAGGAAGILLASIFIFPFANLISVRLELPYLEASVTSIMALVLLSLVITTLSGPLASLYSALKISKAETYFTMREGE
ncbi:MAG: FtsX-like permease family protein [Treponema sp.]|nr:FtsX-like permease family protein [Treponema sp.]